MVLPDRVVEGDEEGDEVAGCVPGEGQSSAFEVPSWPGASAGSSKSPWTRLCLPCQVTVGLSGAGESSSRRIKCRPPLGPLNGQAAHPQSEATEADGETTARRR